MLSQFTAPTTGAASRCTAIIYALFVIVSGALLVLNKAAVDAYPHPNTLLLLQLGSSAGLSYVVGLRSGEVNPLTHGRVAEVSPLALSFLLALFTSLQALQHVNVDSLVALRLCTPAAVAVSEWMLLKTGAQPNWVPLGFVLVLASAAYGMQQAATSAVGMLWGMAWFLSSTFNQVHSAYHAKAVKLTPLGRVYYENLLSSGPAFLAFLAFDLPMFHKLLQIGVWEGTLITLSCILGFAMSWLGWSLKEASTGAMAYTLLGAFSKSTSIVINAAVWSKHGPTISAFLLLIAILVLSVYQQQQQHRVARTSSKDKEMLPNPVSFWWGILAAAAAVGGLVLLLASIGVAINRGSPAVAHSRQQLEQELQLIKQEYQHLKKEAIKLEHQAVDYSRKHLPHSITAATAEPTAGAGGTAAGAAAAAGSSSSSTDGTSRAESSDSRVSSKSTGTGNSSKDKVTSSDTSSSSIKDKQAGAEAVAGQQEQPSEEYLARLREAVKKPILAVVMTGLFWNMEDSKTANCSLHGVPLTCKVTMDRAKEKVAAADLLYYHVPSFSGAPAEKAFPNQLRLAMSLESATYYTSLDDQRFMCQFDAEMSYRQCAQVINWYSLETFDELSQTPLVPFEQKIHAIAYINSNCGAPSGRSRIMEDLIKVNGSVPVHALGACARNTPWPPGNPSKRQVLNKYKFCVTMENSLAHDYVTEKIWDGLAAGCVPVYMGSPSARRMIPDPKGVIIYDPKGGGDASNPAELDALMHAIGSNKTRYEEMVAWKLRKPEEQPSSLFRYLWSVRHTTGECFLCQFLAKHRMDPKPRYTTCLFNSTWMAEAHQKPTEEFKCPPGGI